MAEYYIRPAPGLTLADVYRKMGLIMAKDKEGHGSEKRAEHGPYSNGSHAHGEDFKIGQRVHAGLGAKGGAGFHGHVTKVSEHEVELRGEHKGVFGHKTYKAPKRFVSKA